MPDDLPDVNVWLALSSRDHLHHKRALRYWEKEASRRVVFCRLTMLGFLRLSTTRSAMSGIPFTSDEAWSLYRAFMRQPGVEMRPEPIGYEEALAGWTELKHFPPSRWTDAAIGAWAKSANCRMVSFDGDFALLRGLEFLHLQD